MSILLSVGGSFTEAFTAIAPIVNPLGCALLYARMTARYTHRERVVLARRIAINSTLVLLVAIWAGAVLMGIFGVGLPALHVAGGLVVAAEGWRLLSTSAEASSPTAPAGLLDNGAFVPLTIPFTTGPGTLGAAMALGTSRPTAAGGLLAYVAGTSAATLAVAASVWIAYAVSDRALALLGPARAQALTRLSAFVLLCVGTQILTRGLRASLI